MNRLTALAMLVGCVAVIIEWHWWGVLALWLGASVVLGLYTAAEIAAQRDRQVPPRTRYKGFDPARDRTRDRTPLRPQLARPVAMNAYSDSCTCPGCGAQVLVGGPSGPVVVPLGHEIVDAFATSSAPLAVTFSCPVRQFTVTVSLVRASGPTVEPSPTFLDDGTGRLICAKHAIPTDDGRYLLAPEFGCAACANQE